MHGYWQVGVQVTIKKKSKIFRVIASDQTHRTSITDPKELIMFMEVINVRSVNHTKQAHDFDVVCTVHRTSLCT